MSTPSEDEPRPCRWTAEELDDAAAALSEYLTLIDEVVEARCTPEWIKASLARVVANGSKRKNSKEHGNDPW